MRDERKTRLINTGQLSGDPPFVFAPLIARMRRAHADPQRTTAPVFLFAPPLLAFSFVRHRNAIAE